MKNPNKFLLLLALLVLGCQSSDSSAGAEWSDDRLPPQQMNNGHFVWQAEAFRLEVAPEMGGRLVSLQWKDEELLTPYSVDSLAYGSTLWPSPMTWGWPPPEVIDTKPHQARLAGDTLYLTSPIEAGWGWRLEKALLAWPQEGRFVCFYRIENRTDSMRSVAAWEVPRFPKGSQVFARIDTQGLPFKALENIPYGLDGQGHLWIDVPADYDGRSQKVSYDGAEPWIGVQHGGAAVLRSSEPLAPEQLAPKAGELEVYVDDNSNYIEVEIQGPYQALAPGEAATLRVNWVVMDAPADSSEWWEGPRTGRGGS